VDNISQLEDNYKMYLSNIALWLPEGMIHVDLPLLSRLNLLSNIPTDTAMTRHFQVIESSEKILLFNAQFIVWIVPQQHPISSITYVFIAINRGENLHLELAFSASGIFNNTRIVLRVLERYLQEIQETEDTLHKILSCS